MRPLEATHRRRCGHALAVLLAFALLAAPAGARTAQTAPQGIDVSHWNGQIDWLQVGAAGYVFAYLNATDGTTVTDATYPLNRSGFGSVGMRVGAYHFARPAGSSDSTVSASAIAQADAFLAFAQPQPGDLLPALDLEKTGSLSSSRLTQWTQAWLDEVAVRLGVKPTIYASPNFWKQAVGDTPVFAVAGDRLWIAHWTSAALPILPGAGWGGLGWTFWQWSDCAHVKGIPHCVDADRFNGNAVSTAAIPAYPAGLPVAADARPSIVGTPQAGRLLAALPGGWVGGKPVSFGYQWQSCAAGGAGCVPIAGASGETYTPTSAQAGHPVVVSVTATTAAGTAVASSPPTLAVASSGVAPVAAPKPVSLPTLAGTVEVGQTLTALPGKWSGAPTSFSYQWRRCTPTGEACATIPNAAGTSYTLTPDDIGAALSLVVTATGRGGSNSASAALTGIILPVPVPTPVPGSAVAVAGQAGAVASPDSTATVTWQPGAVPAQATVSLGPGASRLALAGTALSLAVAAPPPLPFALDVQYAAAPADAVPGILPVAGVWQPVAQLPSPLLPAGQAAGAYRDGSGALHVLTRTPGRIALFAPGKWGDPRFDSVARPNMALVDTPVSAPRPDGTVLLLARFTIDSQAHVYASLVRPGGDEALLLQHGSRLGWWLQGLPTKTFQTLQLQPGALPIRIRVPASQLRATGTYTLRITAIDPYGRRSRLSVLFTPTH